MMIAVFFPYTINKKKKNESYFDTCLHRPANKHSTSNKYLFFIAIKHEVAKSARRYVCTRES